MTKQEISMIAEAIAESRSGFHGFDGCDRAQQAITVVANQIAETVLVILGDVRFNAEARERFIASCTNA